MKRQKTRQRRNGGSSLLPVAILVLGFVGLIGLYAYGIARNAGPAAGTEPSMAKKEQDGCIHSPVTVSIPGMERVACTSAAHVREGQQVAYANDPPLGGEHWPSWVAPGFYQAAQPKEKLVHSLEHGHVVIYYNEAKLSAGELAAVKKLTTQYKGQWDGVVAIPRPDSEDAAILTAWEHGLRLAAWDQALVDRFVDAFRGRGPENPVRPLS